MRKKLAGFIHTTPATIGMVERFMHICAQDIEIVHIHNGLMKRDNFACPVGVTPESNIERYESYAQELYAAGCDIIVSCCSLMRRATANAARKVKIPFIQLDAVVLDAAADGYERIGVINTTEYVVPYIVEHINERAQVLGRKPEVIFSNNTGVLGLFNAGDFDNHDRIVLEDIEKLEAKSVDCVLMGQIPFGLMEEKIKAARFSVPVLLAGEYAFRHVAGVLARKSR